MQEQQLRSYLRNMRQSGVKHAFLHGTSKEQMHLAAMNGPQDQCSKRITAVPGASAQDSQEGATPKQSKAPVVRLYDKLDQLEKRWMSQKAPKSKAEARTLDQSTVSTRRDQPEPSPKVTKKTQRPRVVSTFDKLYQKGKAMGIARHRIPQSPSHPPVNRQKRRQESATKIQRVFRGKKARECFRGYQGAATVILLWWKNRIIHRLHFLRLLHATIIVQSLTRKRVVLNAINQKQKAAVVIQEFWRTIQTKKRQLALIKTLLEQANVAKKAECLATNDKATPVTDEKGQNPVASSESLTTIYRAAKLRRKKAGKTALSKTEEDYQCSHRARSSSCHRSRSDANNDRTGSRARSASPSPRVLDMVQRPAYAYLPGRSYKKDRKFRITNFLRGCYDEEMLSKLHILQKWTRVQLRNLIVRHACVKIQACWRHYQAQTQLVSDILLKEW